MNFIIVLPVCISVTNVASTWAVADTIWCYFCKFEGVTVGNRIDITNAEVRHLNEKSKVKNMICIKSSFIFFMKMNL